MSKQYEESGVSLHRGYDVVNNVKKLIPQTFNQGVMSNVGDFGGLFDLTKYTIQEPVLVSGTDGVGTKLLIAQAANKHDTIGIDLVAMCVNDIVTVGATPLFFLDYIATGKIDANVIQSVLQGIVEGCKQSGTALIGGETAEMPNMYQTNHYDLAGFTTGVVDKSKIIDKKNVKEGDILLGLPSSGLHSNGYSLVRKMLFKDHSFTLDETIEELGCTLQEELLKPTMIYVKPVQALLQKHAIHSIAHITGGGFYENIPRAIPEHLGVSIHIGTWPIHPIFTFLQQVGKLDSDELYHVFNMGIGMVLVVAKEDVNNVQETLEELHVASHQIGEVTIQKGVQLLW